MKFKKIMPVVLLLALLTIGAVCASEDINASDTLAVDETVGEDLTVPVEETDDNLVIDDNLAIDEKTDDLAVDGDTEEIAAGEKDNLEVPESNDEVIADPDDSGDHFQTGDKSINMTVDFPGEIDAGKTYSIVVNLTNDETEPNIVTGAVLYVDDDSEPVAEAYSKIINNTLSQIILNYRFMEWETHTYNLVMLGDEVYKPLNQTFTRTITDYDFEFVRDNDYNNQDKKLFFTIPEDVYVNINAFINGRHVTVWSDDDSRYYVILETAYLNNGYNEFNYTFKNKKGETVKKSVLLWAGDEISCPWENTFDGSEVVSLQLPANASGKLVVYAGDYIPEEDYYDSLEFEGLGLTWAKEFELSNGFASFNLGDAIFFGKHSVKICYESDDETYLVSPILRNVKLEPKITVPGFAFTGKEINASAYFDVFGLSGNLTVYKLVVMYDEWGDPIEDDEWPYGYEYVKMFEVPLNRGYTYFTLPAIEESQDFAFYSHEVHSSLEEAVHKSVKLINLNEVLVVYTDNIGDEYLAGDELLFSYDISDDFNGTVNVYLDGNPVNSTVFDEDVYDRTYVPVYLSLTGLDEGTHRVTVNATGNINVSYEFTVNVADVIIEFITPDVEGNVDVKYAKTAASVRLAETTAGKVVVLVNGQEFKTINATVKEMTIDLSSLNLEEDYLVNITYYDGENRIKASKKQSIRFAYYIDYDIPVDGFVYGQKNAIIIHVPKDIGNGNFNVFIDDVKKNWKVNSNGEILVDVSGMSIGEHDLFVEYTGDEKYSRNSRFDVFEIVGAITGIKDEHDVFYPGKGPISLTLPKDADGSLIVTVYAMDYEDEYGVYYDWDAIVEEAILLKNGKASYSLDNLAIGKYTVEVEYDGEYYVSSITSEIVVQPNVAYDVGDLNITDTKTFTIQTQGTGGTLNVAVYLARQTGTDAGGLPVYEYTLTDSLSADVSNGNAAVTFTPAKVGHYFANITYVKNGDVLYKDDGCYFDVIPKYSIPGEIIYNTTANIAFETLAGDDGDVNVTFIQRDNAGAVILNETVPAKLVDGKASIEIPKYSLGFYNVIVSYAGKCGEYLSDESANGFEVTPSIKIPSQLKEGEDAVIEFELDGAEGNLTVTVNGKEYQATVTGGKGSVTIPAADLKGGDNEISLKYVGNDGTVYEKSAADAGSKFNIKFKVNPTMTIKNNAPTASSNLIFTITVADKLSVGTVSLTINNKKYTASFCNGIATINVGKLPAKTYDVTVTYNGDAKYLQLTKKTTARVYFDPKITGKDTKVFYQSGGKYSVTVYGKDGKVAKGVSVVFKVNGKKFKTVKTNAKGVASIVITQMPKTYKVAATALGKTITKKVTVKPILTFKKVKVKKSAKKLVLTAKLKKALKGKKIIFKFNGKKYTAKTNKKGVAKVTIKKKVLKKLKVGKKVKYQASYVKQTIKYTVKVKK